MDDDMGLWHFERVFQYMYTGSYDSDPCPMGDSFFLAQVKIAKVANYLKMPALQYYIHYEMFDKVFASTTIDPLLVEAAECLYEEPDAYSPEFRLGMVELMDMDYSDWIGKVLDGPSDCLRQSLDLSHDYIRYTAKRRRDVTEVQTYECQGTNCDIVFYLQAYDNPNEWPEGIFCPYCKSQENMFQTDIHSLEILVSTIESVVNHG